MTVIPLHVTQKCIYERALIYEPLHDNITERLPVSPVHLTHDNIERSLHLYGIESPASLLWKTVFIKAECMILIPDHSLTNACSLS